MSLLIYIIISALPLIYWYLTRNYNYWSKRGIKGPRPIPFFGNFLDFLTPQHIIDVNYYRKYGPIYGFYTFNKPILCVAEPELIKTILVKDFHLFPERSENRIKHPILKQSVVDATGDDWKRIRSISSPTFTSGKMKKMYPLIKECLNDFMTHLDTFAKEGKDINAKDMFGNLTMDVIATCAFATKTNIHKELDSPFVQNAKKIFNVNIFKRVISILIPSWLSKLFNFKEVANDEREFFLDTVRKIISERRKSDKKYNDFVQLLIDADISSVDSIDDQNDVNEAHHVNEGKEELDIGKKAMKMNMVNKKLTEEEQLAQATVFLLAGYETTATLLTYCTYELALQKRVQQRLADEVNGALDSNGEISYEELSRLPFLDAIISESLRLHPPAVKTARIAASEYKLGDTGITLSKGQQVVISIYAIQHDEKFYPEPYKFNPDRFMPENRHLITPYTYLPFGAGPRNCIGMRFALLEAKFALAHIIRRFEFVRSPQTDVPLLPNLSFGLNSPKRVVVGIKKRV